MTMYHHKLVLIVGTALEVLTIGEIGRIFRLSPAPANQEPSLEIANLIYAFDGKKSLNHYFASDRFGEELEPGWVEVISIPCKSPTVLHSSPQLASGTGNSDRRKIVVAPPNTPARNGISMGPIDGPQHTQTCSVRDTMNSALPLLIMFFDVQLLYVP